MTSPKDDLEELKPDVGDGGALTSPDEERAEDVSVVALVDESAMQARWTQEGAGAAAVDVVRDRAVRPGTVAVVDEPGESDEPGEVEGPDEPVEGAVAAESAELEPESEAERTGDEPSATPDEPGGERARAGEPDPDAEGPTESAAVVGEGESGEPGEAEGPDPAEQPLEGAVAAFPVMPRTGFFPGLSVLEALSPAWPSTSAGSSAICRRVVSALRAMKRDCAVSSSNSPRIFCRSRARRWS
mgnify:CR=1 FL=1